MNERVLFVDDEEYILAAFRRQLRKEFDLMTARSGAEGLDVLLREGPFAVVVADMRMPGIDGIQFLTRVKEIAPNTSRIMLTGHAELSTAVDAVNNGKIFRFLTKPCSTEALVQAVKSGLEQYRLVTAEQDLLEKTLSQSVQLLTEVFSLSTPVAFSRTLRMHTIVQHLAGRLAVEDIWQCKLAAMLSQIGCIAISPSILEKMANGQPLNQDEENLFATHPTIGSRLIRNIPRLEVVAAMVEAQLKPYQDYPLVLWGKDEQQAALGAQILKAAQDYDQLIGSQLAHDEALEVMKGRAGRYNPRVLKALAEGPMLINRMVFKLVDARSLDLGMVLDEDVFSKTGKQLGSRYEAVTHALLSRFEIEMENHGIVGPFRVFAREDALAAAATAEESG